MGMNCFSWRSAFLATTVCLVFAGAAMAQNQEGCWRNGEKHPHGSKVGGYTCVNGSWER